MLSEVNVAGVYMAPLMIYASVGIPIFVAARRILARVGLMRWFWHPALFEFALSLSIVALLVLFV